MKKLINENIIVYTKDIDTNKITFPKEGIYRVGMYLLSTESFCLPFYWNGSRNEADFIEFPYFCFGININKKITSSLYELEKLPTSITELTLSCLSDEQFEQVKRLTNKLRKELLNFPCLFRQNDLVSICGEPFHVDSIDQSQINNFDTFYICDSHTTLSVLFQHELELQVMIDSSLNTSVGLSSLFYKNSRYVQLCTKQPSVFEIEPLNISSSIILISPLIASYFKLTHLSKISVLFINIPNTVLPWVHISSQICVGSFFQRCVPIFNSLPIYINSIPVVLTSSQLGFISKTTRFIVDTGYSFKSTFSSLKPLLPSVIKLNDSIHLISKNNLQLFHYAIDHQLSLSLSLSGNVSFCLDVFSILFRLSIFPFHFNFYNYCVISLESITSPLLTKQFIEIKKEPTIVMFIRTNKATDSVISTTQRFIEDCERFHLPIISLFYPSVEFVISTIQIKENKQSHTIFQEKKIFGYIEQRKKLEEVILSMSHPIQPLKPSGILLYGPSGCGKTTLVEDFCYHHSWLNIKIIRGSELLSKYVGESERNVRELFDETVDLIVFDDFDSLGHRRDGEKTDSVVNTLLTMLDGVAERKTAVVALSNRPDLIDPALLRGGRLGDWIYLGLPSDNDKEEVLSTMCSMTWSNFSLKTKDWTMGDIVSCLQKISGVILQTQDKEKKINILKTAIETFKASGPMMDFSPFKQFVINTSSIGRDMVLI
ncbi:nuclear valosin-containing protein [Entamoeba histolytica HM-3:IMSS]|uniref:Nuclear valosin-containing protein, putative n=6 Tax=Entamoeba histolytica TaxID=5759 RepID=C4LYP3_ENTH1|nr:Nuclear valosin-containing protein, putative [Entamoeba histolytica HM-1:IMSS]EMD46191.1 nuclear valosin-containing protein, putative [Entamoeba histolytica KU27]EMS15549.1 nuclear valosin-containing protein [Entamoeba histolytica HM-3:IMSS]ENY65689.1 nuclear valosin-containing protein, putative [Entamoeba histolytica HM-1:IMSS-A]GAT93950.1 AAA family ATPase putative [Entamoeba histolytica]EAL44813.1 Nuclear valosin-containing protein, putative [Entamoeba histolytica HM-1:IMSS]|eukprot:XP_650199.1 Nuclear valosin-containing protein, putative [Entamoeba histolytica HM-1:IMSS]